MEKEKLSMICLFSGIGCQEEGFKNSECFDIDVVATSDIEPDSIYEYAIIHCGLTQEVLDTYNYPPVEKMAQFLSDRNIGLDVKTMKCKDWSKYTKGKKLNDLKKYYVATVLSNNLGDITKIEELPYADFWFTSSPCQSVSLAGKQEGLKKDSGTRSALIWETEPLLKKAIESGKCPKFLCLENVDNMVGKKHKPDFDEWLHSVEALGFTSHWTILNSKNCGVPQNRKRLFCLFIRNDIENGKFEFPKPFDNGLRLKDILDKDVDDKYYLKNLQNFFINHSLDSEKEGNGFRFKPHNPDHADTAFSVTTRAGGRMDDNYVNDENLSEEPFFEFNEKNISKTNELKQVGQIYGFGKEPNPQAGRIYDADYISPSLDSMQGGNRMPKTLTDKIKIRKLTPPETYALQGMKKEYAIKGSEMGICDSHLYFQAGNGITSNCTMLIAQHLFKALYDENFICYDESFQN